MSRGKGGRDPGLANGARDQRELDKKKKKRKMKRKNKWQCRAAVMSERKNASHVGGKQESGNRDKRAEEREKYDDREVSRKRMRGRKWVTDGESVTVRRNEDIKRG